jgi:hypothetical protein
MKSIFVGKPLEKRKLGLGKWLEWGQEMQQNFGGINVLENGSCFEDQEDRITLRWMLGREVVKR